MVAEIGRETVVGAGTVLSPADLDAALEAGAEFIVSPGLTDSLAKAQELAASKRFDLIITNITVKTRTTGIFGPARIFTIEICAIRS